MSRYDDIIDLSRPVSKKHPPMKRSDRAAQFAPFQALTGFGATIIEEARLTNEKPQLDETEKERLDRRLALIREGADTMPEVKLTVFVADRNKSGGEITQKVIRIKKLDETERFIMAQDGERIPLDDILGIDSEIFGSMPGI